MGLTGPDTIMVVEEKHGTWYYKARTPEELDASALTILRSRIDYYIQCPEPEGEETNEWSRPRHDEERKLAAITDEEVAAIPSDEVRVQMRKKIKEARAAIKYREELRVEYAEAKRISELESSLVPVVRKRRVKDADGNTVYEDYETVESQAWNLLRDRADGEYESVYLETLQ